MDKEMVDHYVGLIQWYRMRKAKKKLWQRLYNAKQEVRDRKLQNANARRIARGLPSLTDLNTHLHELDEDERTLIKETPFTELPTYLQDYVYNRNKTVFDMLDLDTFEVEILTTWEWGDVPFYIKELAPEMQNVVIDEVERGWLEEAEDIDNVPSFLKEEAMDAFITKEIEQRKRKEKTQWAKSYRRSYQQAYMTLYNQTEKGRKARERYLASEKGQEARERYRTSEKGRESQKRATQKYFSTEKGLEARRKAQREYQQRKRDGAKNESKEI